MLLFLRDIDKLLLDYHAFSLHIKDEIILTNFKELFPIYVFLPFKFCFLCYTLLTRTSGRP
jgi:hypothetical protein